jgi:hypothetical protein
MDLVDWKMTPGKLPQRMTLTNPDTQTDYEVEILDYFGAYQIDNLPGFIAREILNKNATGHTLTRLLKERVPEFKNCKKVLFYQVSPMIKQSVLDDLIKWVGSNSPHHFDEFKIIIQNFRLTNG